MGIPSYFMHIVRNYPQIIHAYSTTPIDVDNLYLDCNSVIYAAYYEILAARKEQAVAMTPDVGMDIIRNTCAKLDEYIRIIAPNKSVLIAFDGVAPVAKLEQQRSRRYKSVYQASVMDRIHGTETKGTSAKNIWSTTAITPGTIFMRELGKQVTAYYKENAMVHVSGSDEVGEGEHKIFAHIRNNPVAHATDVTVIYGLDADLIMLSINHLTISPYTYLFRETPEFIQNIDRSLEPNGNYLLDIPAFALAMQDSSRIPHHDYIFMCFFLGNDFMPHFPAINIRTGGHDKLVAAYKELELGESDAMQFVVVADNTIRIQWPIVARFVHHLAGKEEAFLIKEHKQRDVATKRIAQRSLINRNLPADLARNAAFEQFEQSPQVERQVERNINPFKRNWQSRYYEQLFHKDDAVDDICRQYVEGLEWTMKYYTQDCPDYRWKYMYHYPPLLVDLAAYLSAASFPLTEFIPASVQPPVQPLVQLCYVLPKTQLHLLPRALSWKMELNHPEWHGNDYRISTAYCRYFWESHVHMPTIHIAELESLVSNK